VVVKRVKSWINTLFSLLSAMITVNTYFKLERVL
jgi:hypothetical protein